MKKYILILIVLGISLNNTFAQDAEATDEPVYGAFESGILIDHQTTVIPDTKTLEFIIQHKFGSMDNGISDFWGMYSPGANVRLALNYVPINNLQIGAGLTKTNMTTDLNAKWTILEQTQSNSIPVAVALYGNVAIDGSDLDELNTEVVNTRDPLKYMYEKATPGFSDRLSYYSELIVGRKFTEWFSLQAGASFTHYNMVDWNYDHDVIGAHVNGRIKFSPQSSIIFNYDAPLKIKGISEQTNWDTHANYNLSVGIEISTYTHAFQMYVGNARGIIPQHMMLYNQNEWSAEGLAIGFTITRLWMY
jgi:hypothetical protein